MLAGQILPFPAPFPPGGPTRQAPPRHPDEIAEALSFALRYDGWHRIRGLSARGDTGSYDRCDPHFTDPSRLFRWRRRCFRLADFHAALLARALTGFAAFQAALLAR